MTMKSLALATLLLAGPLLARGASAGQPPSTDTLVHVDVSVVDAAGEPIRGLVPGDFDISRNGTPIEPVGFTPIDIPLPEGAASLPAPGRMGPNDVPFDVHRNDDLIDRYVVLVLDDIRPPGDEGGARWMADAGLDVARSVIERLTPADRGAVFFSWLGRRQGLTGDRRRLLAAIDEFATRPVAADECGPAGCLVDTLQGAADILPRLPRQRKVLLYISGSAPLPAVSIPAAGTAASSPLQRVVQSLQEANAVVYSITAPGVTPASGDGTMHLAAATGGRAMVDAMSGAGIDALFRETGTYYLLSLPAGTGDGFQPLTVDVGRAGGRVHTRAGYFPPAPDTATAALSPLEAAIVAPHPGATLPLGASVAAFAAPDRREAIVSVVAAVTGALAGGAKSWQAELAATAFDPEWRPRASYRQTIEVTPRGGARTQTVDVITGLELLPGRYEVRVAAETGARTGSVFVDLEVPDFRTASFAVSGVVVSTMPVPYAANDLLAGVLPVTPTTRRTFRTDEAAEVFLRLYQSGGGAGDVTMSLRIADGRGEGIIQGSEVVAGAGFASGAADWRFVLPLDRLAPGEYLLTIEAALDGRTETRHVRFAVVG